MAEVAVDEPVELLPGRRQRDGVGDGEREHVHSDLRRRCFDDVDLHLGEAGCYPKRVLRCPRMRDTQVALQTDGRGAQ